MKMKKGVFYSSIVFSIVFVVVCVYLADWHYSAFNDAQDNSDNSLTVYYRTPPSTTRSPEEERRTLNTVTPLTTGKTVTSAPVVRKSQGGHADTSSENRRHPPDGEDFQLTSFDPLEGVLTGDALKEVYTNHSPSRVGEVNPFFQPASYAQIASAEASLRNLEKLYNADGLDGAAAADTIRAFTSSLAGDEMMAYLQLCATGDETAVIKFRQERGFYLPDESRSRFPATAREEWAQSPAYEVHEMNDRSFIHSITSVDGTPDSFTTAAPKADSALDSLTEQPAHSPLSNLSKPVQNVSAFEQEFPSRNNHHVSSYDSTYDDLDDDYGSEGEDKGSRLDDMPPKSIPRDINQPAPPVDGR